MDEQSGSPPASPPMLKNPCQAPPEKRFTRVALPLVKMEQITPPALSVVQPGPDTAEVVRLARALQEVPL